MSVEEVRRKLDHIEDDNIREIFEDILDIIEYMNEEILAINNEIRKLRDTINESVEYPKKRRR